jgi:hypothetical protein
MSEESHKLENEETIEKTNLWFVEEKLRRCSTYTGEQEFLQEHEKKQTWRILNDD